MSVKLFGYATLVGDVQAALSSGEVSSWSDLDVETQRQLIELSSRLRRVQALGGAYELIALSPEVDALLCGAEEYENVSQSRVMVN